VSKAGVSYMQRNLTKIPQAHEIMSDVVDDQSTTAFVEVFRTMCIFRLHLRHQNCYLCHLWRAASFGLHVRRGSMHGEAYDCLKEVWFYLSQMF